MPKEKLTQQFVNLVYCPEGKTRVDFYDESIVGFVLEVRASGGKTYGLRYRDSHGRQRQFRIGNVGSITLDKARREAQKVLSRVTVGENPSEERGIKRTVLTIEQLSQRYLEHVRSYKRSPEIDERYLKNHILPRFGRMRLDEVTQAEVVAWLAAKVEYEGYAAATVNRLQVIFSYMYKLADRWGVPGAERNPLKGVPLRNPNDGRERYLTPVETQRLRAAVEASDNKMLRYIVALLLFTGCRKREVLDLRWADVDIERRVLRVALSKSGRARHVPLSGAAVAVLQQIPRWEGCPFVVPNPRSLKPYTSFFNAWDTARRLAGLKDVRVHDLRHSAASNMVNAGQSLFAVQKVLGHRQARTTQIYAHLAQETLIAAADAGAEVSGW